MRNDVFEVHRELSALDELNREDFKDDSSYLAAAVELQLKLDSPQYRQARAKVVKAWQERQRAAAEEADRAAFEEAVKTYVLPEYTKRQIKAKAQQKAVEEINSGRITADRLDEVTKRYVDEMSVQAKRDAVTTQRMNERLRRQLEGR